MYTFAGVPQNVVGQSIVLRDSLSFGQFDLLKSKISIRVDGGFKFWSIVYQPLPTHPTIYNPP